MTDQTRAAFEAHFQLTQRQAWTHKDGSYRNTDVQKWWEGWQAGVAAAPVAAAAPGAVPDDAKDAAPSDELTVKCAYCGKQVTKGTECLNARFAMECRQSR